MTRTTCRRSRKTRYCESCSYLAIRPGDLYLESVCSPNHDGLGNQGWWRLAQCVVCATRTGRSYLFDNRAMA